jgi:zinc transport system permease protein
MIAGAFLTAIFTTVGLGISYEPDLPPGATIILLAGTVYVIVLVVAQLYRVKGRRRTATRPASAATAAQEAGSGTN